MAEQVLNAVLQRGGGGWATRAGALHVQEHRTITETAERDVAAILRHGRADASFQQFLDGGDDGFVTLFEELTFLVRNFGRNRRAHDWPAGHEMFHNRAENGRLQMLPLGIILGNGDEVETEIDAGHTRNGEEPFSERRGLRLRGVEKLSGPAFQHHLARQELERSGIRRRFRLNEHCLSPSRSPFTPRNLEFFQKYARRSYTSSPDMIITFKKSPTLQSNPWRVSKVRRFPHPTRCRVER
ncbi:hypothetical protein AT6N2_C2195 [Agrobacterium tumefaciens]|nr:hypothetical protein AT6N2_C2195 [Agrobacterium tumefaciens]